MSDDDLVLRYSVLNYDNRKVRCGRWLGHLLVFFMLGWMDERRRGRMMGAEGSGRDEVLRPALRMCEFVVYI